MVTCGALMYVICYCVCDKTRTCSVLIKETFHRSLLRYRSYLINDGLSAWGVIHYWSFGGKKGGCGDLGNSCLHIQYIACKANRYFLAREQCE